MAPCQSGPDRLRPVGGLHQRADVLRQPDHRPVAAVPDRYGSSTAAERSSGCSSRRAAILCPVRRGPRPVGACDQAPGMRTRSGRSHCPSPQWRCNRPIRCSSRSRTKIRHQKIEVDVQGLLGHLAGHHNVLRRTAVSAVLWRSEQLQQSRPCRPVQIDEPCMGDRDPVCRTGDAETEPSPGLVHGVAHHQRATASGQLPLQTVGQRSRSSLRRSRRCRPSSRRSNVLDKGGPVRLNGREQRITLGFLHIREVAVGVRLVRTYASASSRRRPAGSVADSTTTGTRYAPSHDSTRSR